MTASTELIEEFFSSHFTLRLLAARKKDEHRKNDRRESLSFKIKITVHNTLPWVVSTLKIIPDWPKPVFLFDLLLNEQDVIQHAQDRPSNCLDLQAV